MGGRVGSEMRTHVRMSVRHCALEAVVTQLGGTKGVNHKTHLEDNRAWKADRLGGERNRWPHFALG